MPPSIHTSVKFHDSMEQYLALFGRITFKLGKLAYFKALSSQWIFAYFSLSLRS